MTTNYQYTDQEFFHPKAFERVLNNEIIFGLFFSGTMDGTDLTLRFSSALSGAQKTTLDIAVAAIDADAVQWETIRAIRDKLCENFIWRIQRYERHDRLFLEQIDVLVDLDIYMQTLADITTQPDPFNITWPVPI